MCVAQNLTSIDKCTEPNQAAEHDTRTAVVIAPLNILHNFIAMSEDVCHNYLVCNLLLHCCTILLQLRLKKNTPTDPQSNPLVILQPQGQW